MIKKESTKVIINDTLECIKDQKVCNQLHDRMSDGQRDNIGAFFHRKHFCRDKEGKETPERTFFSLVLIKNVRKLLMCHPLVFRNLLQTFLIVLIAHCAMYGEQVLERGN